MLFNSVEFSDPVELALALQADWDRAQEQLIQRTDGGVLSQQVGLLLGACGMAESQQLLADTANPPARLANLLLSLNPDLPPIYKGKDIRPEAISAGLSDSATAVQYIDMLENHRSGLAHTGVLTCWRTLQGMAAAPVVEIRVKEALRYLDRQKGLIQTHLDSEGICKLKTATYAVAANPGSEDSARIHLEETDSTLANRQGWWTALASETNDFAPILAIHTEHAAREQTNQEDTRVEIKRKESERREQETATRQVLQRKATSLTMEIAEFEKLYGPIKTVGHRVAVGCLAVPILHLILVLHAFAAMALTTSSTTNGVLIGVLFALTDAALVWIWISRRRQRKKLTLLTRELEEVRHELRRA